MYVPTVYGAKPGRPIMHDYTLVVKTTKAGEGAYFIYHFLLLFFHVLVLSDLPLMIKRTNFADDDK